MEKLLTVVIPTYNMEKYLQHCLESLIIDDQELFNQLEVLVVNDGSKDSSSAIAHEFEEKYPQSIRVIDKENGNYGSCVNRGVKEAKGKYIKILDADDSFDTYILQNYLDFIGTQDADMIVNDFVFVSETGDIVNKKAYQLESNCINRAFDEIIGKVFLKKNIQMHGVAYKHKLLVDMAYKQTEGISYTDQEWTYTPLFRVNTISYFNGFLYHYLVGRSGQTMDPSVYSKSIPQNEICVIRKFKDYLSIQANSAGGKYFTDKWIKGNLMNAYRNYMPEFYNLDLQKLISFDDTIMSLSPTSQKILDDITLPYTNYHFINRWRKNNKKFETSLYSKLMVLQSKGVIYILRRLKLYYS